MATFDFADGLSVDPLHDIDDPFSKSAPLPRISEPPREPPMPEVEVDDPFDDAQTNPGVVPAEEHEWQPAPSYSRASGAISIPTPLFESKERTASRGQASKPMLALVLGLVSIIAAAAVTAVREHAPDATLALWPTRGSTAQASLLAIETPLAEPGQSERFGSIIGDFAANPAPRSTAPQAAPPLELPAIVFSSRSHVRIVLKPHAHTHRAAHPHSVATHGSAPRAAQPTAASRSEAEAVPSNPYQRPAHLLNAASSMAAPARPARAVAHR